MAQLIKLRDFISRYETDIFRYPSQYIRLKKERWNKIRAALEQREEIFEPSFIEETTKNNSLEPFVGFENFDENWLEKDRRGMFDFMKRWFKKSKNEESDDTFDSLENSFKSSTHFILEDNKTEQEIKQDFLDDLFRFQINWASSTIRDYSFIDEEYYQDEVLKYFLQHFPDNYFILYKPTLQVRKAPIDLEIIMISPVKTYCISILESDEMSVYRTNRGHYWFEDISESEIKRINPMLSLNRTEGIVRGYYKQYNVEMPIQKVVLSRTGYIEGDYQPINTLYVDKRNYSEWYSHLRRLSSPIKYVQIKGAQALLKHSQSTYAKRREWSTSEGQFEWDDEIK